MQSKRKSMLEATATVGVGFIVSMLVWEMVVEPFVDVKETVACNFMITCIYTCFSLARCYVVRRLFNKGG